MEIAFQERYQDGIAAETESVEREAHTCLRAHAAMT
jgi:hypothetical protein